MKIVIPGGTGQIGHLLAREWGHHHEVVVLTRSVRDVPGARTVLWDGRSLGTWGREIDGADVVVNLAGRTVNCRYTKSNLAQMYDSRIESTRAVGEAIASSSTPPRVWLQMSTATIYAHTYTRDQDEDTGVLGGSEPDVPRYWDFSIKIGRDWEAEQTKANTPSTRKVALRSAMVMTPDSGGIYSTLSNLSRKGLGGTIGGGSQYMSWIHGSDFVRALEWLIEHDVSGPINLCAPQPLPQTEFMAKLRGSLGVRIGLPATKWMARIGAVLMGTDTELVFKSRRVVPGRLLTEGFRFQFPNWTSAAADLARQSAGE